LGKGEESKTLEDNTRATFNWTVKSLAHGLKSGGFFPFLFAGLVGQVFS